MLPLIGEVPISIGLFWEEFASLGVNVPIFAIFGVFTFVAAAGETMTTYTTIGTAWPTIVDMNAPCFLRWCGCPKFCIAMR